MKRFDTVWRVDIEREKIRVEQGREARKENARDRLIKQRKNVVVIEEKKTYMHR